MKGWRTKKIVASDNKTESRTVLAASSGVRGAVVSLAETVGSNQTRLICAIVTIGVVWDDDDRVCRFTKGINYLGLSLLVGIDSS